MLSNGQRCELTTGPKKMTGKIEVSPQYDRLDSGLRPDNFGTSPRQADVYIVEIQRRKGSSSSERGDRLLVEKREAFERDSAGDVHRGKLRIFYWDLGNEYADGDMPDGEFGACYDRGFNSVSITSSCLSTGGYVLIEPQRLRGAGLGTYFMNRAVQWAKQWPDAQVREIELPRGEPRESVNQVRRIHFYGKFGIAFDFTGDVSPCGASRPMAARDLTEVTSWQDTISEHSAVVFLRERVHETERSAAEIAFLRRSLKQDNIMLSQAYQRPVKWMFQRLVTDNLTRTGFIVAFGVVIGLGLYRAF